MSSIDAAILFPNGFAGRHADDLRRTLSMTLLRLQWESAHEKRSPNAEVSRQLVRAQLQTVFNVDATEPRECWHAREEERLPGAERPAVVALREGCSQRVRG